MRTYFKSHIILLSLASICLGNLTFISAAQAGESERINQERQNELRNEREQREYNSNFNKKLDQQIHNNYLNNHPSNQNSSNVGDFAGGLGGIAGIFLPYLLTPSVISDNGKISYGTQGKIDIANGAANGRGGIQFRPEGLTWNFGFTLNLIKEGDIRPFIGGGVGNKGMGGDMDLVSAFTRSFYATAGVDILPIGLTIQANQAVNNSLEFQASLNLLGL